MHNFNFFNDRYTTISFSDIREKKIYLKNIYIGLARYSNQLSAIMYKLRCSDYKLKYFDATGKELNSFARDIARVVLYTKDELVLEEFDTNFGVTPTETNNRVTLSSPSGVMTANFELRRGAAQVSCTVNTEHFMKCSHPPIAAYASSLIAAHAKKCKRILKEDRARIMVKKQKLAEMKKDIGEVIADREEQLQADLEKIDRLLESSDFANVTGSTQIVSNGYFDANFLIDECVGWAESEI